MRIFTVISFLVLTNDLRTCKPFELSVTRDESDGNRMQDDTSDGVVTGRVVRDVGSASFKDYVYPVQVDLTEWTRKFEQKFGDFTKLVDLRFKALDSLVKGLEERFDAMDRRQNETENLTATRFEEVEERINRFENSKMQTEARLKELETRINDQCPRPTAIPDSSSSFRPTATPLVSTVTTPSDDWILIQRHKFSDKNTFKHKLWDDYKNEFGDRVNDYWLGLQRMHDMTKNGRWSLKITVKFDLDHEGNPSSRQGESGAGVWESFSVASEEEQFKLSLGNLIERENFGSKDPMHFTRGMKFSTEDRDNDEADRYANGNCAREFGGGWWFANCSWFCANCQIIDFYDGSGEKLSESAMWMKQDIDD